MLIKLGGDSEKDSKTRVQDAAFANCQPELKACVARKQSDNCSLQMTW